MKGYTLHFFFFYLILLITYVKIQKNVSLNLKKIKINSNKYFKVLN